MLRTIFERHSIAVELRAGLLLICDLKPTCRNSDGETPIMVAIATGNQAAAEFLIDKGHPVTEEDYLYAVTRYPGLKHFIADHL